MMKVRENAEKEIQKKVGNISQTNLLNKPTDAKKLNSKEAERILQILKNP